MKRQPMLIEEILTIWPQSNTRDWANEVGTSFFAEDVDLDKNGWLDPWSRPIDKRKLSKMSGGYTTDGKIKWRNRYMDVQLEGKYSTETIRLHVYSKTPMI